MESDSAETICNRIVTLGVHIQEQYKMAKVYVAHLTPRADKFNSKSMKVNSMLDKRLPESISIIPGENITGRDLYDKKHIKEMSIPKLIANMKEAIKKAIGSTEYSRDDRVPNRLVTRPRDDKVVDHSTNLNLHDALRGIQEILTKVVGQNLHKNR